MQPDKQAIIINLYSSGTQDEVWMKKRLDGIDKNRVFFCNLDQFLNQFIYGDNPELGADEAVQPDPEPTSITEITVL